MSISSTLFDIGIKKRNKEISESWQELADMHSDGLFSTGEAYRCWMKEQIRKNGDINSSLKSKPAIEVAAELPNYKEEVSINSDGSQSSNKLVRMSIEQSKDVNFLLEAHGYDKNAWELISAKSNIWNVYSQADGISTLYSSKISVKPLSNNFNFERLIDSIKSVKPAVLSSTEKVFVQDKRLLEISLLDTHFGISDSEYYKPSHDRISDKITSRRWEEILFVVGQDMFHNDDFRGRTSNSTPIEVVDMEKAWSDCLKFYQTLIDLAMRNSNNLKIMYSKGNHDESMSWAFVQLLKALFPTVQFDDSFIERKVHTFGDNFIGITHGDKARKNLHNIFPIEFPMEWARAKNREIHIGHLHVEDGKDVFGIMVRTLSTRNKTDQWHKNNGFVGAHKRFMLFEYSETELESIHYV